MYNASSSLTSLNLFVSTALSSALVGFTFVFNDSYLSSPFDGVGRKYCTPKGAQGLKEDECNRWNCTCDGKIRRNVVDLDVFAAMFLVEYQGKPQTFLLPLSDKLPFNNSAPLSSRWSALHRILTAPQLIPKSPKIVTYNLIPQILPYLSRGYSVQEVMGNVFDLQVASYMLCPGKRDEKEYEFEEIWEKFASPSSFTPTALSPTVPQPLSILCKYKDDLHRALILHSITRSALHSAAVSDAFYQIESPLTALLAELEFNGVGFLPDRLLSIRENLEKECEKISQRVRAFSDDDDFNIRSSQQVSTLLFEKLKLKQPRHNPYSAKRMKTEQISTSNEILTALKTAHPVCALVLEYRKLQKLKSTYILPLCKFAIPPKSKTSAYFAPTDPASTQTPHRIHPMWIQVGTRTGRLSCRKPNLQNIPSSSIFGGVHPRDSFVASPGFTLFSCDYSQNEVRILAHMSMDPVLLSLFNDQHSNSTDVYKRISMMITGKSDPSQVTTIERAIAKQITLAIVYGMGVAQVAKKLEVDSATAGSFFKSFFLRFPTVKTWIEGVKRQAKLDGYVRTITGRRRMLENINSDNTQNRAQAERQAVNTAIQGSAADIMKLGMLKTAKFLKIWRDKKGPLRTPLMLLQIHDELLFETPCSAESVKLLSSVITRCCGVDVKSELKLSVDLVLHMKVGRTWGVAMRDAIV
ncbi:hypothetical protein TrVE_jg2826 [Triparma verrucosa]|uniref:DNA-directed DNA polymerase n=1 Tax=Triparma verrucosa TaxID=1606542 RepID=A0A9W7BBF7_9STRA|nr:hypothetical protein TrVE_jg2826 [Triparma verrucosa]